MLLHDARDVVVLEKNHLAIYNSHSIAMTYERAAFSLPLEILQAVYFATLRNKPMRMLVSGYQKSFSPALGISESLHNSAH